MMRNWFFDLDGTLANTGEDIVVAWRQALTELGRDLAHFDEVFSIGPSLESIVYRLYDDATPELVAELLARFKPLYDESGFPNTVPYAGIPELLNVLKRNGARLFIVTNKRHAPTQLIVRKLGWHNVFDGVWSYDTLETKYTKPQLLARLVRDLAVEPRDSVMVGDTDGDVNSGKTNGMATIGVSWGYGSRETLVEADAIFDRVDIDGFCNFKTVCF